MACVKLIAVGGDFQFAVLTNDGKLGVCGKTETRLWELQHNTDVDIYGLTFLPGGKTLVAWTADTVIVWSVDIATRTSKRVAESDYDTITRVINTFAANKTVRIIRVEHVAAMKTTHIIVATNENTLQRHTITGSEVTSKTFLSPESPVLAAVVIDEQYLVARTATELFTCTDTECNSVRKLHNANSALAHFQNHLMFIDDNDDPSIITPTFHCFI